MSEQSTPPPSEPGTADAVAVARRRRLLPGLAGIGAAVGLLALAFAWVAGWLTPARLTPEVMIDAIEATGPPHPGYRRAHTKGVCVAGYFDSNGRGAALSKAAVLAPGRTPLLGRMSIGGGMPHGSDGEARVRSMALQLVASDGQQWRMAMNSFPFFSVPTAQAFLEQTRAGTPDPATGKPDPAAMAAIAQRYPSAAAFGQWAKTAPWSDSFANTQYNGIHTFGFIDARGGRHDVRWAMRPQAPFVEMTATQRAQASPDFLADDLAARLARGPLRWDMVVTQARDGDALDDPSIAWSAEHPQVVVGTVVLESMQPQATGPCRDLNFDPLVLPTGVVRSNDPILAARSAAYSVSFNRREREIGSGRAPEAAGQPGAQP